MTNQWISHVKQYAAQHGCSYSDALKRAKSSYSGSSKPRRKTQKGKGMWDWADPNKNGTTQFFTKDLPREMVHQGIPAVGATLGGIAGAELGPVGSMAGAYAGRKAGEATANKINELYGIGLYSDMKKAGKAALKKNISYYAPAVGQNLARAGADYIGIPSGVAGLGGYYAGQYVANKLNSAIGEGVRRKRKLKGRGPLRDSILQQYHNELNKRTDKEIERANKKLMGMGQPVYMTQDYRGPNDPRKMKGMGNFWEDIAPATTYLRPVGDALVDKTVEKIRGSGNFWGDIAPATTYLRPVGDALVDKTVEKIKGLGLKKRVHRKKRGGALYAAGYGGPM